MTEDPIEERLREVIIGESEPADIVIAEYDEAWPERFRREAGRIRAALGGSPLAVEHIGSTSVPGLAAKPIVDLLLVVENSADEASYVPAMEAAGYVLRVRERDFYEHRMFRTPEIERCLMLRDRLRSDAKDRELYARTKRALARRDWPSIQHYAEAKSEVIEDILARAAAPSPRDG